MRPFESRQVVPAGAGRDITKGPDKSTLPDPICSEGGSLPPSEMQHGLHLESDSTHKDANSFFLSLHFLHLASTGLTRYKKITLSPHAMPTCLVLGPGFKNMFTKILTKFTFSGKWLPIIFIYMETAYLLSTPTSVQSSCFAGKIPILFSIFI